LKVNDDRRIHINLSNLAPKLKPDPTKKQDKSNSSLGSYKQASGKMLLLTVKVTE
jgi:hypothetical protein